MICPNIVFYIVLSGVNLLIERIKVTMFRINSQVSKASIVHLVDH